MYNSPFLLKAGVQHYPWGDTEYIPALLGVPNPDNRPFAELWMGAHPNLPATVELAGQRLPLDELIDSAGQEILGPQVAGRFDGRLPYLFKVLSAAVPLSIQVHPTKRQAEAGFARENALGIPLTAPQRNYKDDNHKPEILAALTDFYALRGFRPLEEIGQVVVDVPELRQLMNDFAPTYSSLKTLYERCMSLSQPEVDSVLKPLIARLRAAERTRPFEPTEREYWVLEADRVFSRDGHADRGLFSVFLLNLVHLRPGEAVFLPAGVLHAYLCGAGVELMANSNNVLRGGLTPKHVDVPELLANVVFQGGPAEVIRPVPLQDGIEWSYPAPASEFELRRIDLVAERCFRSGSDHNVDMLIVTRADRSTQITLEANGEAMSIRRGDAVLVPCGVAFELRAAGPACLFRATVPDSALAE